MPRSFCRIAGRAPYKLALRINSLGKVSAKAAAIGATTLSSLSAARENVAVTHPLAAFETVLLSRYENTGGDGSSLGRKGNSSQGMAKLFSRLEKRRGTAAVLLV